MIFDWNGLEMLAQRRGLPHDLLHRVERELRLILVRRRTHHLRARLNRPRSDKSPYRRPVVVLPFLRGSSTQAVVMIRAYSPESFERDTQPNTGAK
jgi:hypothetical protein